MQGTEAQAQQQLQQYQQRLQQQAHQQQLQQQMLQRQQQLQKQQQQKQQQLYQQQLHQQQLHPQQLQQQREQNQRVPQQPQGARFLQPTPKYAQPKPPPAERASQVQMPRFSLQQLQAMQVKWPGMQHLQATPQEARDAEMMTVQAQLHERNIEYAQHEVKQSMDGGVLLPGRINLSHPARMTQQQIEEMEQERSAQRPPVSEDVMREAFLQKHQGALLEQQALMQQHMQLQAAVAAQNEAADLQARAEQLREMNLQEEEQLHMHAMEQRQQEELQEQQQLAKEARLAADAENSATPPAPKPPVAPAPPQPQDPPGQEQKQPTLTMEQLIQINTKQEEEKRKLQRKYLEKRRRIEELIAEKNQLLQMEESQAAELAEFQDAMEKQRKQQERSLAWNKHMQSAQEDRLMAVEAKNCEMFEVQHQYVEFLQKQLAEQQQQQKQMHEVMQQAVQQTAGQMARFQEKQEQPAGHTELHQQAEANTHRQQQQLQEALAEQQAKRPSGSMTPPPVTPRMPFVGEPVTPTPHTMFFQKGPEERGFLWEKRGVQGRTQLTPEPCSLKAVFSILSMNSFLH